VFVYGLNVTVNDAATATRICDATVTVSEGAYSETLQPFGPVESCSYSGAGERPGLYEVRATRAGYRTTAVPNVRVTADECHVIPVQLTVPLSR
jgi:hypothetical protein